ncbi:hypothetical protein [Shewanella sp.]|uniref:hypothetical protein n=1 Tax=Shewanella sp. TaxID=50422 RepID=UPI004053D8DB
MISSISSAAAMPPPRSEKSLTQEQQTLITETLSQFDPENLTESDAISITKAFSQAGIQPGKALGSAISELGFDAKNIGDLAGVEKTGRKPPPPPPQQESQDLSPILDFLATLMEEKLAANDNKTLSDEDKQSIINQTFEKFGMEGQSSLIDVSA